MSKTGMKVYLITAVSLAIIALSILTITLHAQPNNKDSALSATNFDEVKGLKGNGLQKMLKYRYLLPPGKGLGLIKTVELSEEFKENILNILNNNDTTSQLLSEGYEVSLIRPLIKLVVQGDGTLALKVVEVHVTLHKNGEGAFRVLIDYEKGEVVKIWGGKYCECKCLSS